MREKETEYIAKTRRKDGYESEWPVRGLEQDMLDKELWGRWCYSGTGNHYVVPKINDARIPEKDLYELGFVKIINIIRKETIKTETLIYG